MRLEELQLHTSPFLEGYSNGDKDVVRFFDYKSPYDKHEWAKRQQELKRYSFPRKGLTDYLTSYNQRIGSSAKTIKNIQKLKADESLAVVGGQQAGLLTGPLLVIYKCISTIQLAKEAQKELNVPVVPIFWIAGEDHDMDEINHIMVPKNNTAKKISLKSASSVKSSASLWEWNRDEVQPWLKEVFHSFGETAYTSDLLAETERILNESDSIVTFFAKLLSKWFSEEGLIVLDSGDPSFKKLQSTMLKEMIVHNSEIDHAFNDRTEELCRSGFSEPIEVQENNAHLFYTKNQERILLYRDENGFSSKEKDFKISESELLEEAVKHPEKFSNNVVTRPLMQEFLLPVLSFVAGPGEIAYWAVLGKVFSQFNRLMPILTPRLSFTLVTDQVNELVQSKKLTVQQVLENGTDGYKREWFALNRPIETFETVQSVKAEFTSSYEKLIKLAEDIDSTLLPVADQNMKRILSEIDYMENKLEQRVRKKVKEPLAEFDEIMLQLKPTVILQERIWNIYQFVNEEGPELVNKLVQYPYQFNGKHKIVYL
ncbi:bacillithiol biosynthesis cysteine-adding enzyme BshC [Fictibacillus sp. 7GRE50]|uniref:bacillithiol biosynthesis cysteine-adding enzyme BshC n=1 Tax=Fictibacillus sp. 7GRE50 TaxID=2745878 RepID=UPI0018CE7900|nr:bacillithiol biosynthesis cysteine-adding enzyme BshC [Fictibacillus sp. 7GRE50]MBH0165979.1 bacillithiol biosynthesis cysteine-adding enzyme BshC [Fictibacillus sp. 7GRE50]